ncbi:MAG: thioredoxin family protein [Candidatus Symbiothrix sp.]|jgi:thiol-disulfide isomerase/thioredoxin|nr:thioredoxin family protein [Candidatus Symbiothrix sp.]
MQKKILKLSVYGIVIFFILFLGIHSVSKIKDKQLAKENIQIFKPFCAQNIVTSTEFCTNSLLNKPIIVMFMHPECDFCQEEIKQLKENQEKLKNVYILLITSAPIKQAQKFYEDQELFQLTNVQFLSDENTKLSDYFDANVIPSIFVYNNKLKLVHKCIGEIKIETLLSYLSE